VLPDRSHEVLEGLQRVLLHDHGGVIALLECARRDRDEPFASPVDPGDEDLALQIERGDRLADEVRRDLDAHPEQVAGREGLLDLLAGVREHEDHLLHAPARGGDRRDVQALVDVCPHRVVDARDHLGDVVGLARDPGRQDVGVVPARDRQERIRLLDAGVLEHVPVEPEPHDRSGLEPRRQAGERRGVLVDHGDLVTGLRELLREQDADTATTHDDHAHGWLP
jgi:hypothetical protein